MQVFKSRHQTHTVHVRYADNDVTIGGQSPVRVQSMTNMATADVDATVKQIVELHRAGSELVRLTVNTPEAARAVVSIREKLDAMNCSVPLVGDFHYNGHKLLTEVVECAAALSKYRINPGNVGKGERGMENFARMIEVALEHDKPVRIGVNGGSLDPQILERMLEENRRAGLPETPSEVQLHAMVASALESAREAEKLGLAADHIVLSAKVSAVQDLVAVYRELASKCEYALHLGLTEAGIGTKGVVASSVSMGTLLAEGIGDTIRVSITPMPGAARTEEVRVAQELLQTMGLRAFCPLVVSCPGCGRTSSALFQQLASQTQDYLIEMTPIWRQKANGFENMTVAVMGCVVNGPGESRHANIGISLPGNGESPVAPVFADGQKIATIKGESDDVNSIIGRFKELIDEYVLTHYCQKDKNF